MKNINVGSLIVSNERPFTLIAGPCQLESRDHGMKMAESLKEITSSLKIPFIFKTSFDKANRTSISGKRGIGLEQSLPIFEEIKKTFDCPVTTDVHTQEQCKTVAEVVDLLQIPAFLCRQTDLLIAAGKTGKAINVKKGQFLSPQEASNIPQKISSTGNENIMLCERGTTFGYNNLIVDMRGLAIMSQTGYPVCFDATHSVMQPGLQGSKSGGNRDHAPILARAAVSIGIAALFTETHDDPDNAPSDGPNMIKLENMKEILKILKELDAIAKSNPIRL